MNRFLHIIVNQQSRNSMTHFKNLLIELPKYTNQYKIHQTSTTEQLDKLIELLKVSIDPEDILVVVGGDGSLNCAVSLLEKHDVQNTIGYIPAGSGNDFARAHGIPTKIKAAVAHLFKVKETRDLSIIHATEGETERYAVNSLGIGIDGLVNYVIVEQRKKKGAGSFGYLSSLVSEFKKQDKFSMVLKVDEGTFTFERAQIALIANNPYFGGGLKIVPGANGKDDMLEVLVGEDVNFKDLLNILVRILTNKSHLKHPKLHTYKTRQLALFTDSEQYAQKDGESFKQDGFAYIITTKKRAFWI